MVPSRNAAKADNCPWRLEHAAFGCLWKCIYWLLYNTNYLQSPSLAEILHLKLAVQHSCLMHKTMISQPAPGQHTTLLLNFLDSKLTIWITGLNLCILRDDYDDSLSLWQICEWASRWLCDAFWGDHCRPMQFVDLSVRHSFPFLFLPLEDNLPANAQLAASAFSLYVCRDASLMFWWMESGLLCGGKLYRQASV